MGSEQTELLMAFNEFVDVSRPLIEDVAAALANPARAAMVVAMMDGRYWTATELARIAGVAVSSASEHISRLVAAGLVRERRQGRHRYLALASEECAQLVELLGAVSGGTRAAAHSLASQRAEDELQAGRTCYRHLAGQLGVRVLNAWRMAGLVTSEWEVTEAGRHWARTHDLGLETARRELLRPCLDWTMRRDHAAGAFADAFTSWAFSADLMRRGRHPRAVILMPAGRELLSRWERT